MKKCFLLILLPAFLTLGAVSPPGPSQDSEERHGLVQKPFPITIDFECPRNFGFHIGDEIPLTIRLEAKEGTLLDLVNLPQPKENHGPFEIRDLSVRKHHQTGRTIYTVFYRLQTFTPAVAVDRLIFPPLRIYYATKEDWNPVESEYHYRGLFSQPFEIFASRTASFFGPMKDLKGPILDKRAAMMWKMALAVGGVMFLMGFVTWPWELFFRTRRARAQWPELTARDRALKALETARENCFNYDDHRKRLFFEVNSILRNFLKEVCGLDTANRSSMEIMNALSDQPYHEDLRGFVSRINQVIYEGDPPADVESMVRQFSGLLQTIDGTTPGGVDHDKAG
jgi:hypothetical protein